MADSMIQRAEDRRQRTDVCVPHSGTFVKGAAMLRQYTRPLSSAPCFLMSVFCLLSSVFCYAEELPDPTRPSASLVAPVAASADGAAANQPAGLQAIIISKARRAAIIDGETVELGGKHGDAKLVEVHEGGVVLKGAQGRKVLTLFPDIKWVSKKEAETRPLQPVASKVRNGRQKAKPVARKEGK